MIILVAMNITIQMVSRLKFSRNLARKIASGQVIPKACAALVTHPRREFGFDLIKQDGLNPTLKMYASACSV